MSERKIRKAESNNKKEIKLAKTVAKIERIQDGNTASTKVGLVTIEDKQYYFSATVTKMPVVFGHKDPVYASKELAKALNNEMMKKTEGKRIFTSLERIDKQVKYVEEYMLIIKQGKKYFGYMQGKADSRAVVYAEGSKPYSCAAKTLVKDLDRPGKKSFRSMAGQGEDIRKMIDKLMKAIDEMNNNNDDDPEPDKDKLIRKKEEPKDKSEETAAAEEPAIKELKNGNGKSIKRQKRVKTESKPEKKRRERRSAKTKDTKVIETKAEEVIKETEVVEEPENGSPMKLGKDFKEGERTEYYCFDCNEPTTLYRRGYEFVCDNCGKATEIIEDEEYPISDKPIEKSVEEPKIEEVEEPKIEEAEEPKEPEIPEDNINDKIEKLKQDIERNRRTIINIMNTAFEICKCNTNLDDKLCDLTGERADTWIENINTCQPSDEDFITNFEDEVELLLEEECYYELISAIVNKL